MSSQAQLYRPELGVGHTRQLELPGGEALADLSDRGAQGTALLYRGRRPEALSCRLFLRGQPRLATLLGQQPRVSIAREDDVREHVAHGIDHRGAAARVQRRYAIA